MNQDFLYNVGMAGCARPVKEMTVVCLNEIVSGVGRKEGNVLFNDALNTYIYGYMASDLW